MNSIARKRDKYASEWGEVYASLRRSLAGTWKRTNDGPVFELRLDPWGRYELREFERRTSIAGKYAVVQHADEHFIALDKHMGDVAMRIDDIQKNSLRLVMEGSTGHSMSLSRRRPT